MSLLALLPIVAIVALAPMIAAAAVAAEGTTAGVPAAADAPPASGATAAAAAGELWTMAGHDAGDSRFSPLDRIDEHNVAGLRLAWYRDLDTHRGQEATPVVVDGVLYTTTAWSKVLALRAATGELLWQYDPQVPGEVAAQLCCDVVNRGVAVANGRVYLGTLDGRLIALDAASGRPLWSVRTVDRRRPYSITGAPLLAAGLVIIGNGGAEFGVRGYVSAYDAQSGRRRWRFYTVPGNPARGFENEAMRAAARTWRGAWWKDGGGGTVWNSLSYDPALGLVYLGTGNASPWSGPVEGGERGDALYTCSILALRVSDGRYAWHYQTTPADVWDYDAAQTLTLATLTIGGRERRVLMQASKNGFFYVLDRANGELLSATAYVPVNWARGIDPASGRPLVEPQAHYERTGRLWLAIPGGLGGHNWQPMSFSPRTGLVYIPAQQAPFPFLKDPDFKPEPIGLNMGVDLASTSLPQDPARKQAVLASLSGTLLAWDPVAGRAAWRVEQAGPWNGGTLATGGNLVFQGTARGEFVAYRASDGERLWSFDAQTGIIAAPMTFAIEGRQIVVVLAGWGGVFPLVAGELADKSGHLPNRSRILAFALDGTATLPEPPAPSLEIPAPPSAAQIPARVAAGARVYARYCGSCHGDAAHSGGLVPDLRTSRALGDDGLWEAVTLKGALRAQGMVPFGRALGSERLAEVRAYLIERAQQSLAGEDRR